jgi:hypothetical protein
VKAGDRDAGTLERSPEIYREHDLSLLALTIGSGPLSPRVSITSPKSIGLQLKVSASTAAACELRHRFGKEIGFALDSALEEAVAS